MSNAHLLGISTTPLNASLDEYHDAYARLIWDVHAAKNLGHGVSTMLKHSEGRDVVYATPMFSVYVQAELIASPLDALQKNMLAERLELHPRSPIEAGKDYVCAPEYDPQINKKITGFVADAAVKNTIYNPLFMTYDRGDTEQDIRDIDVQKRLIAAMTAFHKEHKQNDAETLDAYCVNPVTVLHSMGLLNDTPVSAQELNTRDIVIPPASRPVIGPKNDEPSHKLKSDRHYRP